MTVESWSDYVRRVAGHLTQVQIADKAGLAQSNVGRWLRGERATPRAESVISFARAFHQNPIEALTAAGYITAEEAGTASRTPLAQFSSDELFNEMRKRSR